MIEPNGVVSSLTLAYVLYAAGTASPGPSNLAIMATAVSAGRRAALVLALGVTAGSALWGLLVGLGMGAVLASSTRALVVLKILGGAYLLWLSIRSLHSAAATRPLASLESGSSEQRAWIVFCRGCAMHLTNPKALLVWISLVAVGMPAGGSATGAMTVVAGCIPIGLLVFGGYALVFSTATAVGIYLRARRWFDGAVGVGYGYAGARMLGSQ